jgi:putative membrane protein
MDRRWISIAALTAAVALAPAVTFAQSAAPATKEKRPATSTDKDADKGKLTAADRKFVTEALQGGMAEVELGKLASERASNDAVKQFGQRMADDHGKAGDELKKIAQDKGMSPPMEMDAKHKKLHDRLAKLSGAEFDRAYMDEMVKDHRTDVKNFQREASGAKDPDVKAFAAKTLPTLQEHLKQAESVHGQVRTAGKGGDTKK